MTTQMQDESEVFRGTTTGATHLRDCRSVRGTPKAGMPAFVLGEEMADMAEDDPRIVVATADLASANRTIDFRDRHADRFVNFLIAEKNMITAAAGMAASGMIPYVATFASFAAILRASLDHDRAMYIRLGRGRDPVVDDDVPEIEFGKAIRSCEGTDMTLIACGCQVRAALDAGETLAGKGFSCG